MNKELEALREKVFKVCKCDIQCEEYDKLVKALTPPTADEVCKALGERFDSDVMFDGEAFVLNHGDNTMAYCYKSLGDTIKINYALPPHLITMIGKFYESLEGEK